MIKREQFRYKDGMLEDTIVLRDAIHNYIVIDHELILALINTKEMQRLRRIKQLGGTYQVYPTAEHSRFSHSLGVYHVVRKMLEQPSINHYLSDYDKLTVMVAGLLHDLGHGPFSHCFEPIFQLDHETYTSKIIREASEVHDVLLTIGEEFVEDVCKVIEKTHPNQVLVQMISSQLDADRMDYLLRDSYFTGTTYGHFDMARILRVMKIKNGRIVYKESGVQAIENYILARYHMYWQVYYHPTGKSFEQMLLAICKRVWDLYRQGYQFKDIGYLEPFLKGNVSVEDYLKLDEGIIHYYFNRFMEEDDSILKNLCYRFLNRHLFEYCSYKTKDDIDAIKQKVKQYGYDPNYYVFTEEAIQIPYHYGDSDKVGEIEIITNDHIVALPEVSEIVWAILNSKKNKNDFKIFYPSIHDKK